ncbi:MAG: DUF1080 domain-containing protein [Planctomycetes bacterium]|nr:DUF1080 domain-containing protein [Planctomycetota bacterium]
MSSRQRIVLVVELALVLGFVSVVSAQPAATEEGFVSVFNGNDLSGWTPMEAMSWSAKDGVLSCSGEGHGWLRSDKEYQNFTLRLEYRILKDGNSGVFIRATEKGNPAFTGMEVQIADDHGKEPTKAATGALYDAVAPAKNMSKPAGEWNQVEITCKGRQMSTTLNGQKLWEIDLDDATLNATIAEEDRARYARELQKARAEDKPPPFREDRQLSKRAPKGFLGLQNHGTPVQFRNIRIKVLQ